MLHRPGQLDWRRTPTHPVSGDTSSHGDSSQGDGSRGYLMFMHVDRLSLQFEGLPEAIGCEVLQSALHEVTKYRLHLIQYPGEGQCSTSNATARVYIMCTV